LSVNVGDLVCYNCAGMRKKTLGFVMSEYITATKKRFIMIRWILKGEFMPKYAWEYYSLKGMDTPWNNYNKTCFVWYEPADYFEVVSECR